MRVGRLMREGRAIGSAALFLFAVACSPAAAMVAPADPGPSIVDSDAAAATLVLQTPSAPADQAPASDPVAGSGGAKAAPTPTVEIAALTPPNSTPQPIAPTTFAPRAESTTTVAPTATVAPPSEPVVSA